MIMIQAVTTKVDEIKKIVAKPDNPTWRKIGNYAAIVGGPLGTLVILIFVPDPYKQSAVATWSAIMGAIKAGSKLTVK